MNTHVESPRGGQHWRPRQRNYGTVPPTVINRHELLQIRINSSSNARHALVESQRQEKRLSIRVRSVPEAQRLRMGWPLSDEEVRS